MAVELASSVGTFFVGRVAGLDFGRLDELRAPRTIALTLGMHANRRALVTMSRSIADDLHGAIGRTLDTAQRGALLRMRRAIFNMKSPKARDLEAALGALGVSQVAAIHAFRQGVEGLGQNERDVHEEFQREKVEARTRFQRLLMDEDLQKGLLVSSPSLFANIDRYIASPPSDQNSRLDQVERGLLRYYARTATKATPFSRLCAVIPGGMADLATTDTAWLSTPPTPKQGFVRLNKALYGVLWRHLRTLPNVRSNLPIELNPTLEERETLRFLANVKGREVFQSLRRSESLMHLLESLRRSTASVRYMQLVDALLGDDVVEATREDASAFLDQLVEIGLLRLISGVDEQEVDWDLRLRAALEGADDESARTSIALLSRLRAHAAAYADAPIGERKTLIDVARSDIDTTLKELGITERLTGDLALLEDATAESSMLLARTDDVDATFRLTARLLNRLLPLASPRVEQATMRHFLDSHYPPDCPPIPLLQFYEEFYRKHYKEHVEREAAARRSGRQDPGYNIRNPFGLEVINRITAAESALVALIAARWAENLEAEQITLHEEEIRSVIADVPYVARTQRLSTSVFGQIVGSPEGHSRLVMTRPNFLAGHGKYYSRFLYMLPPEMRSAVFEENNAAEGVWQAELCGDSHFNGNLHPPLLRWRIAYPTSQATGMADELAASDLEVSRDPADPYALVLHHRVHGVRVIPNDLGFLNLNIRPPLYRLLARFNLLAGAGMRLPDYPATKGTPAVDPSQIRCRPRITFENRIVLSRRQWIIPGSAYPRRQAGEGEAAFFMRIQEWRMEHGLPMQAYLRVQPLPTPFVHAGQVPDSAATGNSTPAESPEAATDQEHVESLEESGMEEDLEPSSLLPSSEDAGEAVPAPAGPNMAPKPRARSSRDWYKPQYIDFSSPLLVRLFERIPVTLPRFIATLEECLPARADLLRAGDTPYATEMVFQLQLQPQ